VLANDPPYSHLDENDIVAVELRPEGIFDLPHNLVNSL
jgi:hypothetical protein